MMANENNLSLLAASSSNGGGISVTLTPEMAQALRQQNQSQGVASHQSQQLHRLQPLTPLNQLTPLSKTIKNAPPHTNSADVSNDGTAFPSTSSDTVTEDSTTIRNESLPATTATTKDNDNDENNSTTKRVMEDDDLQLPVLSISLERLVGYVPTSEEEVNAIRDQLVEAMWKQSTHHEAGDGPTAEGTAKSHSATRTDPPPDFDQHATELFETGMATFHANRSEVEITAAEVGAAEGKDTTSPSSMLIISYPKVLSKPTLLQQQQREDGVGEQDDIQNEKDQPVTIDTKNLWDGIERRGARCSQRVGDAAKMKTTVPTSPNNTNNPNEVILTLPPSIGRNNNSTTPATPTMTTTPIPETIQTLFRYLQHCNRGLFWKHDMSLELQRLIHDEQTRKEYIQYKSKNARLERREKLEQLYSIRDTLQNQCHVQDAQVQQLEQERDAKVAVELRQLKSQREGGVGGIVGGLQALDFESTTPMAFPNEFKLFSLQDDDEEGYEDDWGSYDSYNNDDDDDNYSNYDDDEEKDIGDEGDSLNEDLSKEDPEKATAILMEEDDGYAAQDDDDHHRRHKEAKSPRNDHVRVKPAVTPEKDKDPDTPFAAGTTTTITASGEDDSELFTRIDYGDEENKNGNVSLALPSISSRADKHERQRRRRIKAKQQKQKRRLEREAEKEAAHQVKLEQAMAEEKALQGKHTSHALTMAYSVQTAMEQKLEQVEELLEVLHIEEEEEDDYGNDLNDESESETSASLNGAKTATTFSLLDQILAMILGTSPKKPGMSQEDHYKFVQLEHERIVRDWKAYFGRLPPALSSATAAMSEDNDLQHPQQEQPTREMTAEEKRMALGIAENDKEDWEEVENWNDYIADPSPAAVSATASVSSQELKQNESPLTNNGANTALPLSSPSHVINTTSTNKNAPGAGVTGPPPPQKTQVIGLRPGGKVIPK